MKKSKAIKILCAVLCIILFASILPACGGENENNENKGNNKAIPR